MRSCLAPLIAFGIAGCATGADPRPSAAQLRAGCESVQILGGLKAQVLPANDVAYSLSIATGKREFIGTDRAKSLEGRSPNGWEGKFQWSEQFSGLPNWVGEGLHLGHPAAFSPDRKIFAATNYETSDRTGSSSTVVLAHIEDHRRQSLKVEHRIASIAWSSDGQWMAVGHAEDDDKLRSFTGLWVSMFGWKQVYRNYHVSVFSSAGAYVCTLKAVENVTDTKFVLNWTAD